MTGVIFTSLPTILLFVALQRYFISGMKLSVTAQ
jgi:ABC-type glycerol-3-phosphate transport system permease component